MKFDNTTPCTRNYATETRRRRSPASFDSKELFVRFVFVCDFNKKKGRKGSFVLSSVFFERESIDVSRFVAIAKHDAIFFFVEEGVIAVIRDFSQ